MKNLSKKNKIIVIALILVLVISIIVCVILFSGKKNDANEINDTNTTQNFNEENIQNSNLPITNIEPDEQEVNPTETENLTVEFE